ncbi:MAG: hypothetical protein IJG23_03850 [Clostridia bacterium]|nr:hypothetical protein [Clostridia bacterium]
MMIKIRDFFFKHKIFFAVVALLPLYHFLIAGGGEVFQVKEINYTYHAVDFSMGFCTKLLPGSIYRMLVGVYTREAVSVYLLFVYFFFVILLAVAVEQFARKFKDSSVSCLIFIIFVLTGPLTFNLFVVELGMLDFYWVIFFIPACLCLHNKYLRFFAPVFVFLMIMTHYGSIITYVAGYLFIIALYWLTAQKKKDKTVYFILLCICAVVGCGLALYFIRNEASNVVYNIDEFKNIMYKERDAYPVYYDYSFYKYFGPEYAGSRLAEAYKMGFVGADVKADNIFKFFFTQLKAALYYASVSKMIATYLAALIPQSVLVYILIGYLKKEKANEKTLLKRLEVIAFIVFDFFMGFGAGLMSNDTPRWVGHSVILMFAFVMHLLYFDYSEGMERLNTLLKKIRYPLAWLFLFFYSCIIMDPYVINI